MGLLVQPRALSYVTFTHSAFVPAGQLLLDFTDEEAEPQEWERPAQLVAEPACEAWWVRFQPLCPGAVACFRPQQPRGHRMHPARLGCLGGGLALPGFQRWHPRPAVIMVSGPQILGFVHFGSACFSELLTCTAARLFPEMVVASLSQTLKALVYEFTRSFPEWCARDGCPLPGEAGPIGALPPHPVPPTTLRRPWVSCCSSGASS